MVKAHARPELRKLGKGEAFITVSASNPTQRHMTVVLETPLIMSSGEYDVVCSCMGWTRHKHCWHADEAFMVSNVFAEGDLALAIELLKQYVPEYAFHSDTVLTDLVDKYMKPDETIVEHKVEGNWVPAPDCKIKHAYGEEGWRPGFEGVHEHWVVKGEE